MQTNFENQKNLKLFFCQFQIHPKIVRLRSLLLHDEATWRNQGLKKKNLPSLLEQIFYFKTAGLQGQC
jgi:hypothetical protein